MFQSFIADIRETQSIFQIFLAYDFTSIVGAVLIEAKPNKSIDYYHFQPIHIKRFAVLPEYRSIGIGKRLLDEIKNFVFLDNNKEAFFGESNELGALSFYGREGCLYARKIIEVYSNRNSPKDNIYFFKIFLSDKAFQNYRYPHGNGIPFVYCKTKKTTEFFKNKGFISKLQLLR